MFKAIDTRHENEIVILDPEWEMEIERLRTWGRKNHLVCPGCRQPVRVRAGQHRIRHFAHKHLGKCKYGHASRAVLEAKALLYQWLREKFGQQVELDKELKSEHLKRPVDCWVASPNGTFAYWIIGSQIHPDDRLALQDAFEYLGVSVHWVFLRQMLREDEDRENHVHLNTTEREFIQKSRYDEPYRFWAKGSLHYLDAEAQNLVTFRGLVLVHEPQMYRGHKVKSNLSDLLISPKTGEFVHPGEYQVWVDYQELKRERKKAEEQQHHRECSHIVKTDRNVYIRASSHTQPSENISSTKPAAAQPHPDPRREGICVHCGKKTRDWWYFNGATGECVCHDCEDKPPPTDRRRSILNQTKGET
jgi:hypothetical protein